MIEILKKYPVPWTITDTTLRKTIVAANEEIVHFVDMRAPGSEREFELWSMIAESVNVANEPCDFPEQLDLAVRQRMDKCYNAFAGVDVSDPGAALRELVSAATTDALFSGRGRLADALKPFRHLIAEAVP